MFSKLDTGGAGEHAHATFGEAVGRIARHRPILVHRGYIDDAASAALLDHLPRCDLRAEKRALEVYRHDPVVLRLRRVEHGGARFDAGVVDHDVEPAECFDCRIDHFLQFGNLAHVGLDSAALTSEFRDLLLQLLGRLRMHHVVDDDAGPLACEFQDDRLADPAVAPGDDRNLVLQRHDSCPQ